MDDQRLGPGARRAREEIGRAELGRLRPHPTGDAHLAALIRPVERERRGRERSLLAGELPASLVHVLENHRPGGHPPGLIDGGQRHRVRLADACLDRLRQPSEELHVGAVRGGVRVEFGQGTREHRQGTQEGAAHGCPTSSRSEPTKVGWDRRWP
jgi:hypothetical protein